MSDQPSMAATYSSLVHDVKNSLGLMTSELDGIAAQLAEQDSELEQRVHRLSLESARMNNVLVNLLGLQRQDAGKLIINVQEALVIDVLEDVVARHQRIASQMGVNLSMECDESLCWFFDVLQVESMLNNVVTNAIRYTKNKIHLTAFSKHHEGADWLCFDVIDNGQGYPANLIKGLAQPGKIDLQTGSTGLGLYLSDKVASMHVQADRQGRIELSNTDGAHFMLWLP